MAMAHWQAKAAVGSAVKTPAAIVIAAQTRCKRPWRVWIRILGLPGGVVSEPSEVAMETAALGATRSIRSASFCETR